MELQQDYFNAKCEGTRITELPLDALVHSFRRLDLRDLCNVAASCRFLKDVAYSDVIWDYHLRERWPSEQIQETIFQHLQGRESYLARHSAIQNFQFSDPVDLQFRIADAFTSHIILDKSSVIVAQGSELLKLYPGDHDGNTTYYSTYHGHKSRITCLRLFSTECKSGLRGMLDDNSNVIVTASSDHTVRIWGKNLQRTLRGHTGEVTVLANDLLGDQGAPVLASGGSDCTVRLWCLSSNKRGRSMLKATLHGHENNVKDLAVAEHNSSLLVSISRDSKLRVWDTTISSGSGSGSCVGMARGHGSPIGLKCIGSLCYVASSSSIIAIDLRSMKKATTVCSGKDDLRAFDISRSRTTVCSGGTDKKAKLWDIRNTGSQQDAEPYALLDNHSGPVSLVHIDSYKVVTGGPGDPFLNIWDAVTGDEVCVLDCDDGSGSVDAGVGTMAVKGSRIATGGCGGINGFIRFRDYEKCVLPLQDENSHSQAKFWEIEMSQVL